MLTWWRCVAKGRESGKQSQGIWFCEVGKSIFYEKSYADSCYSLSPKILQLLSRNSDQRCCFSETVQGVSPFYLVYRAESLARRVGGIPMMPCQVDLFQHPLSVFQGVGEGYSRVGTQDSIMIRVPDLTVLVHLIDMTGPLAITSANPSGEVDSTHHDMVISWVPCSMHFYCSANHPTNVQPSWFDALLWEELQHKAVWNTMQLSFFPYRRLGHKLEGVLCDGESDEVVASTVVNCTRIDESECQKHLSSSIFQDCSKSNRSWVPRHLQTCWHVDKICLWRASVLAEWGSKKRSRASKFALEKRKCFKWEGECFWKEGHMFLADHQN